MTKMMMLMMMMMVVVLVLVMLKLNVLCLYKGFWIFWARVLWRLTGCRELCALIITIAIESLCSLQLLVRGRRSLVRSFVRLLVRR